MSEQASAELKQKIVDYLKTQGKAKNRDVAKALGEDKSSSTRQSANLAMRERSNICTSMAPM